MRNIYEIISEQKARVEMKITSYDLDYTINHLMNQEELYSIQEGLGESLKNLGKKVVEFIKKLIGKIKEMINKVLDFFRKTDDVAEELENQIKEANESADKGKEKKSEDDNDEEKEPEPTKGQLKAEEVKNKLNQKAQREKQERSEEDKEKVDKSAKDIVDKRNDKRGYEPYRQRQRQLDASRAAEKMMKNKKERDIEKRTTHYGGEMKISGLEEVLQKSNTRITIPKFPRLMQIYPTIERVFDDIIDEATKKMNNDDFTVAKLNEFIENETIYAGALEKLNFKTIETTVSKMSNEIYLYIKKGMTEVKFLKKLEGHMEEELRLLIKNVENNKEFTERTEAVVSRAANVIGTLCNKYITAIGRVRGICINIARRETSAYCAAVKQQ